MLGVLDATHSGAKWHISHIQNVSSRIECFSSKQHPSTETYTHDISIYNPAPLTDCTNLYCTCVCLCSVIYLHRYVYSRAFLVSPLARFIYGRTGWMNIPSLALLVCTVVLYGVTKRATGDREVARHGDEAHILNGASIATQLYLVGLIFALWNRHVWPFWGLVWPPLRCRKNVFAHLLSSQTVLIIFSS